MTEQSNVQADFRLFFVLWNQQQNMPTPDLHVHMAQWLEEQWHDGNTRLLLMAFRGAGKSTMVGMFAAWLIYRDPNIRIMVLAADLNLSKKMVRNVKRILERHILTRHLKPKGADQWAADRFTVERARESRDPSMMAKGVTANITGSHADIIICDDVEVPNTCDSAEKRLQLRERLAEIAYVLESGGTQVYVGTPHHYYSIYADVARPEIGEDIPFLDGFERLSLPIMDCHGKSACPERYSKADIAQMKRDSGPNKFDSQMMLRPVNITQGRLDPDALQFYTGDVEYDRTVNALYLGHQQMVGASCWWDPAFGHQENRGDDSVLAIVYGDMGGNFYLHHLHYIEIDPHSDVDEATQQARIVADLAKKYYIPAISVETNGIGKFLPNILRKALVKVSCPARVQEKHNTTKKSTRILESFDAVMAAGRLFVHKNVCDTPFIMEMREWQPERNSGRDDALDAVAGALSQHPDRMERFFARGEYSWQKGKNPQRAKSEFDV